MPMELILTVAAVLVAWFVFTGLVRLLKVTAMTAFKIALVVFILQVGFGLGPELIWQRVLQLTHQVMPQISPLPWDFQPSGQSDISN